MMTECVSERGREGVREGKGGWDGKSNLDTRRRRIRIRPPFPTFMNFLRIINWRKGNGGTMEGRNDQVASHLSSGAGVNAAWATTWKEGREA